MPSYYGQELSSILEQEPPVEITPTNHFPLEPYDYYGLKIYPYQPDDTRVANLLDFSHPNGQPKIGMDFWVINYAETEWEQHMVQEESLDKWGRYIEGGRVFVRLI